MDYQRFAYLSCRVLKLYVLVLRFYGFGALGFRFGSFGVLALVHMYVTPSAHRRLSSTWVLGRRHAAAGM